VGEERERVKSIGKIINITTYQRRKGNRSTNKGDGQSNDLWKNFVFLHFQNGYVLKLFGI